MNTLRYAIAVSLGFALPYLVQRWDRARLTPEQRAAAWNGASWGAAIYAFGPLSMLGWAWVTRARYRAWKREGAGYALVRSTALLGAGMLAAALIFGVMVGVDEALGALAGDAASAPR